MDRVSYEIFESEDSEEGFDMLQHPTNIIYDGFPFFHLESPDILCERWSRINLEERKRAGQLLHVSVFWWHILFQQQGNHNTTSWAVAVGFLDSNISSDLTLQRLHRIEILELILHAVEKCLSSPEPEKNAGIMITLSIAFRMQERDCLTNAVSWLEECGCPSLGKKLMDLGSNKTRYQVLEFVFAEYYNYIIGMVRSKKTTLRELSLIPDDIKKSEEMKNKGNTEFQKKNYDLALKWYTKAIKYWTHNHILYGNRALCYIRCEKYLKAMGDGKRAIILQRDWAKGHYRFCDALFYLGDKDKAVKSNKEAQKCCSADPEGMKDLQQQWNRFKAELKEDEGKLKKTEPKKGASKRPDGACGIDCLVPDVPSQKPEAAHDLNTTEKKQTAEDTLKQQEPSGNPATAVEESFKVSEDFKSEMGDRKSQKVSSNSSEKQSVKKKQPMPQEKPQSSSSSSEVSIKEQFCAAVQDAHVALTDQRSRNAEQAFSLALKILDSCGTKDLKIHDQDKSLLVYGFASALIEIGQPEELAEAERQFNKLSTSADRTFQSLVHYGLGKVLLKENRFGRAIEEFTKAQLMVKRQITPGKLTWPTTKVTVKETQPEILMDLLENFIEMCKFPPKPDAVCCHQNSKNHVAEIYFTDPDFKGFIRMSCSQSCKVEYHISCWKKFKRDKNDKEFIDNGCFTPDCTGKICHIVIFDSTGLIKCEFKSSVSKSKEKSKEGSKEKVRQQCTSLKKLKSREERKVRRKQKREAASLLRQMNDVKAEGEANKEEKRVSTKKNIYEDRILHQISENKEHFNDEICSISSILVCLRPWMELDEAKGHVTMFKGCSEPRVLRDLVDLLLERKNRVWARLFIHNLSSLDIKPKLHSWAQQLDNAGLNIAEKCIAQCSNHLEELDYSSLLEFPPLQEMKEKYEPMKELLGDTAFTIIDYLRQATPQEMRLFIWTLEEHRERYNSIFDILNEYFEMDSICLVIKKSEQEKHLSLVCKSKSKHRKKKQKEPKQVLIRTGIGNGLQRDEEEDFFSDEDSLMLLDEVDPFSVPDHLRERVAEFEGQYVSPVHRSHCKRYMDNDPDPTKESLYDYFAQILEEHGPLEASNPLLVGELENFPFEAQQKINAAGGLEIFLHGSLRFVKFNNLIGLASHTVCLQDTAIDDSAFFSYFACGTEDFMDPEGSSHLNPTAKEFHPQHNHLNLKDDSASYDSDDFHHKYSSETSPTCDTFESVIAQNYPFVPQPINGTAKPELLGAECSDFPFTAKEISDYDEDIPLSGVNTFSISVKTCTSDDKELRDDVVINTEPYSPYERNNGDMIQMEKNNIQMKKHIQSMKETQAQLQKEREEARLLLQSQVEQIQQEVEIANKELNLFQDKLEEEVRKGQQEKKDHQEMMKALKAENKQLLDSQESYSKQIQDKSVEYQRQLDHFLTISNQAAAERMSLEDEVQRLRDASAKAAYRSVTAQTAVLQNKREQGLRTLRKLMSDSDVILQNMKETSTRSPGMLAHIEAWKAFVLDIKEKIRRTEMQYEEQIQLVNKGINMSSLPPVSVPCSPPHPPVPAFLHPSSNQRPLLQKPHGRQTPPQVPFGVQQHPIRPPTHSQPAERLTHTPPAVKEGASAPLPTPKPLQPQPHTVYERIIDRLSSMFPHYSRMVLTKFIQEVRVSNGSLNTMTYEQLINRVAQLILDHQERAQVQLNAMGRTGMRENVMPSPPPHVDSSRTTETHPSATAWKSVSSQHRSSSKALNTEDPCIICHDDMSPENMCVLECRHSFHKECIKSWLKEQSTCPNCREHTLLPEDFPMLPGRQRRGHTSTASYS